MKPWREYEQQVFMEFKVRYPSTEILFDQKLVALTILGNLDGLKIGREDLVC